jgi:ABC-type molybdenum transport system ATPase subunit/photorepair protein PhrA
MTIDTRHTNMPGRSGKSTRINTPKQPSSPPAQTNGVQIRATSQQSRFHLASIEVDSTEIDLETVCIAAGEHEVLVDASLKLKEGVRYGLIGRNGCGKSSTFT